MNKRKIFTITLTESEKDFIEYWVATSVYGRIAQTVLNLKRKWITEFKFPIPSSYFKRVLHKYEGDLFFKGGRMYWEFNPQVKKTLYHNLLSDAKYLRALKEATPDLERHAKEYMNQRYKDSLNQGHQDFLAKAAQLPANKKSIQILEKYLSKLSESEYCYTTPEAMTMVVEQDCWFCNPINLLLKPLPDNPLQLCTDDSEVLHSIPFEDKRVLLDLVNNPLVKQWKKIGVGVPLFNIETLEALKFLKENPFIPVVFKGKFSDTCHYLRFNDSVNRFESIVNDQTEWLPQSFGVDFFNTNFRFCTNGELKKYSISI